MLVKDERDIIEPVVRHTLTQVDHVLVWDNGSTDGTREVLDGLDVEVVDDADPGHWQSRKTSEMAAYARESGADWVVPVDADEIWAARNGRIGDVLASLPDAAQLAEAVLFDHVPTAQDNGRNPVEGMRWRKLSREPLRKVACRAMPGLTVHAGNHFADYGTELPLVVLDQLVVRHFPYRTPEQLVSKGRNGAAAYAHTDLPDDVGAHKRLYGQILDEGGEPALRAYFFKHFFSTDPVNDPALVLDPCPLNL